MFAEALRELGTERALVVCGRERLDEISPAGETDVSLSFLPSATRGLWLSPAPLSSNATDSFPRRLPSIHLIYQAWLLADGKVTQLLLHPMRDFNLPCHPLSAVKGLSSTENALLLNALLEPRPSSSPVKAPEGTLADGADVEAITDFILLNTSAVLFVAGLAPSFAAGVELARESMRGGGAKRALEAFRVKAGEAVAQTGTA